MRATLIRAREKYRHIVPQGLAHRLPPGRDRVVDLARLAAGGAMAETLNATILYTATVAAQPHRPPISAYPGRWALFEEQPVKSRHQLFVLAVREASVSGFFPAVVSADGHLFDELSRVHDEPIASHPAYSRIRLPAQTRLDGRSLLLASAYGGSFYHWMMDAIPRLGLVRRAGIDLGSFQHVILPSPGGAFVDESLAHFPELKATRHRLDDSTHFECEELICPSLPQPVGETSRSAAAFLKRTFLTGRHRSTSGRRLLLSRAKAPRRRLHNEDQLWRDVLAPAGFTRLFFEDLSFEQQVAAAAEASTIVAPHGAALTHLVFARRSCAAVELLSSAYPSSCFWNLADAIGQPYRYVVGRTIDSDQPGSARDFEVDPDDLGRCLADMHLE